MYLLTMKCLYDRSYVEVGEKLYSTKEQAEKYKVQWMKKQGCIANWRFVQIGRGDSM